MKHIVSNSERSTATCNHRWLLKYGLGLRTNKRVRSMDIGSYTHIGLDAYFSQEAHQPGDGYVDSRHLSLQKATEAIHQAYVNDYNSAQLPENVVDPSRYMSKEDLQGLYEDSLQAVRIIEGYHSTWNNSSLNIILNEAYLATPVMAPTGNVSKRTMYGGRVDKLVELNGKLFIMEHKTTKTNLNDWLATNGRSPQAMAYAWILRQKGYDVKGVIWDLLLTYTPRQWTELAVLKSGDRLAKSAGLPHTTADEFLFAVQQVKLVSTGTAGTLQDCEWYEPTYNALLARDQSGYWYRREVELFSEEDIERTGKELYHLSTRIRRWRDEVRPYRDKMLKAIGSPVMPSVVEEALQELGPMFPRDSNVCWQYNRLCPYASLCSSQSRHDVVGFYVEPAEDGHAELVEDPKKSTQL